MERLPEEEGEAESERLTFSPLFLKLCCMYHLPAAFSAFPNLAAPTIPVVKDTASSPPRYLFSSFSLVMESILFLLMFPLRIKIIFPGLLCSSAWP